MRMTNAVRDKIAFAVDKKIKASVNELYAERNATEKQIQEQLNEIKAEAEAKAQKLLSQYPGAKFIEYRHVGSFILECAAIRLPEDEELTLKASEIRERGKELKMDLEIRCQLEKDADAFFNLLKNIEL